MKPKNENISFSANKLWAVRDEVTKEEDVEEERGRNKNANKSH